VRGTSKRLVLAAIGLLVVAGIALALLVPRSAGHPAELAGAEIQGSPSAPDFRLRDATGRPVDLRSLRGDVVLVTFLYVHCRDVCPLIASTLDEAVRTLGFHAHAIAISVDPRGDTPRAVRAFMRARGLGLRFRYALGSRAQLAPVWHSYYVEAQPARGEVLHSGMTVLVDGKGRERVRYDASATAPQIVHDVRALKL
jgi:protein SCO1/2